MDSREGGKGALGDVRVLDLAGPLGAYCTKLLADLGAEVIKVEKPGGCCTRDIGPFFHDDPHREKSLYFFHFNANKRSITLDIETADGAEVFKRLVRSSDIVVETFPPGYLERRGLGYPALQEVNPAVIFTSVTPFGQTGPYRDYKGSDIIGLAMGGLLYIGGFPEDPPSQAGPWQACHETSVNACVATLAALYNRDVTGQGQWVDVSMQECVAVALQFVMQFYDLRRELIVRNGTSLATSSAFPARRLPGMGLYPCKDGYVNLFPLGRIPELVDWMESKKMAGALKEERWQEVLAVISTTESLTRLFGNPAAAEKYMTEEFPYIDGLVAAFVGAHNKKEMCEEAQSRRIPAVPVNDVRDLLSNPQLVFRNFFVDVHYPELRVKLTHVGSPYRLSETPWQIVRRAPLVGEDNREIYEDEMGIPRESLRLFKEGGII